MAFYRLVRVVRLIKNDSQKLSHHSKSIKQETVMNKASSRNLLKILLANLTKFYYLYSTSSACSTLNGKYKLGPLFWRSF